MAGKFIVYKGKGGREIGRSQMYKSSSGCRNGKKSMVCSAADAAVVEK